MKKILLVSHCLLNTASKLKSYDLGDMEAKEALRRSLLKAAIDNGGAAAAAALPGAFAVRCPALGTHLRPV